MSQNVTLDLNHCLDWGSGFIFEERFPEFCERCGLRRIRFHELRHTNLSLLLDSGASMKDIQSWAGHSSYSTTANVYAHIQSKSKEKLSQMLDKIIV